jgi:hypothetical protein
VVNLLSKSAHDIFKAIHKQFDPANMIPILQVPANRLKAYGITRKDLDAICEALDCSINDLYFHPNSLLNQFVYYKDYVYLSFFSFSCEHINRIGLTLDAYRKQIENIRRMREEKDFQNYFFLLEKQIRFQVFIDLYDEIPDEQKYDVFMDIYRRGEYGFSIFKPELIRDVMKYKHLSSEYSAPMSERLKSWIDADGYVPIYRGEGSESTPVDQAYSWTLEYRVALFFATRFGSRGPIYHAKVHVDDIIEYMPKRNEEEVLVFYDTLQDVKIVNGPVISTDG